MAALTTLLTGTAYAEYPQDGFFSQNLTVTDLLPFDVIVGFANINDFMKRENPANPTLTVAAGAETQSIALYNGSTLQWAGVMDTNDNDGLDAYDTSNVFITGGALAPRVHQNSTVTATGGRAFIAAFDDATVGMSGVTASTLTALGRVNATVGAGDYESLYFGSHSVAEVSGATTRYLNLANDATVALSGGELQASPFNPQLDLAVPDRVTLTVSDYAIARDVFVRDGAKMDARDFAVGQDLRLSGLTTFAGQSVTVARDLRVVGGGDGTGDGTGETQDLAFGLIGGRVGRSLEFTRAVGTIGDVDVAQSVSATYGRLSMSGGSATGVSASVGSTLALDGVDVQFGVTVGGRAAEVARLTAANGSVGFVEVTDHAHADLSALTVAGQVYAAGEETELRLDRVTAASLQVEGDTLLTFTGSDIAGNANIWGNNEITLSGGSIGGNLNLFGTAHGTISGTRVGVDLVAGSDGGTVLDAVEIGCTLGLGFNHEMTVDGDTRIGGDLLVSDDAKLFLNGGTAASISVVEDGTVNLTGGTIAGDVIADGHAAQIDMRDATINGFLGARGDGEVAMTGGTVGGLGASGNGRLSVIGGSVGTVVDLNGESVSELTNIVVAGDVSADFEAELDLGNVTIGGNLRADGSSNVNVNGGTVGDIGVRSGADVNFNAGEVRTILSVRDEGTLTMNGGTVSNAAVAHDFGEL